MIKKLRKLCSVETGLLANYTVLLKRGVHLQNVSVLERVQTPRGELQLQRRGNHFEMISNGTFLMATYNGESERLLVSAALKDARHPKRVLIGGLGVGFSLAEALRFPSIHEVTVIEIEDKIIDWNRTHLSAFSERALEDPRTRIVHDDFLEWMIHTEETFDAICLDIDNGPDWTVTDANKNLYQQNSLTRLANLLEPHGVIAFWSASSSPVFHQLLKRLFHHVTERKVPGERGEADCIYIASLQRKRT